MVFINIKLTYDIYYVIKSIPALMVFNNGEIKWNQAGVIQPNQIINIIKAIKRNQY